ncbi:MAG TPA: hypothetical protein VID48_10750 [Solirubrobacteraceae bacterium]|jgi:hypothetical protein
MRWLIVTVVQLPDGSTGLRMDAQVVWVTPRPASERIPSGTHTLLVSVGGVIPANNPKQRPLTVSSSKKINGIVGLLNVLPAAQPGVFSCPVDFGVRVRLAFYARRGVAPLAIAIVDPDGCGGVSLTIGGQPQPPLGSKAHPGSSTPSRTSLVQQIDHLLGVKLKIGPA